MQKSSIELIINKAGGSKNNGDKSTNSNSSTTSILSTSSSSNNDLTEEPFNVISAFTRPISTTTPLQQMNSSISKSRIKQTSSSSTYSLKTVEKVEKPSRRCDSSFQISRQNFNSRDPIICYNEEDQERGDGGGLRNELRCGKTTTTTSSSKYWNKDDEPSPTTTIKVVTTSSTKNLRATSKVGSLLFRYCGCHPLHLLSYLSNSVNQKALRVLVLATVLCILHMIGTIFTLVLITKIQAEQRETEIRKMVSDDYLCTTALFCPVYKLLSSDFTALVVQLCGSVCGLALNLLLVMAVLTSVPWAIAIWLASYTIAILGCIILFAVVIKAVYFDNIRQTFTSSSPSSFMESLSFDDVHHHSSQQSTLFIDPSFEITPPQKEPSYSIPEIDTSTKFQIIIPLLMAIAYSICYFMVVQLWIQLRKRRGQLTK